MNVVYELRQRAGLTQELLANLVGVDRSRISRFETGRSSPTLVMLKRLAEATSVDVVVTVRPEPRDDALEPREMASAAAPLASPSSSSDLDTSTRGGVVFTTDGGTGA